MNVARAALPPDTHSGANLGHAGLNVGKAVDFNQAIETDTHHAKGTARRTAYRGFPKTLLAG